jgi:hypothetical protein
VSRGDVAAETARRLDVDCTTAPPFEPPGQTTRQAAAADVRAADVVVTTGGAERGVLESVLTDHDRVLDIETVAGATGPSEGIERAVAQAVRSPEAMADD